MLHANEMNQDLGDGRSFQISPEGRSDKSALHIDLIGGVVTLTNMSPEDFIQVGAFLLAMGKKLKARKRLIVEPLIGCTTVEEAYKAWNENKPFLLYGFVERTCKEDAKNMEEIVIVFNDGKDDVTLQRDRVNNEWFISAMEE